MTGEMTMTDSGSIACCPRDGTPLIFTFAFAGKEFICLTCGYLCGMFGHIASKPATPELEERYAALMAEWGENAGSKIMPKGTRIKGCDKCKDEDHASHASDEEMKASGDAYTWIGKRTSQKETSQ